MTYLFDPNVSWLAFLLAYSIKSSVIQGAGYLVVMLWKTMAVKEKYQLLGWTLVISAVFPSISFFLPEWNPLLIGLKEPIAVQLNRVINLVQLPSTTVIASGLSLIGIVLMIWIGGIVWNLLRVLIGQITTRRIIRAGTLVEDDSLVDLARTLGVDSKVKLLHSPRTTVPFTVGLTRPVIVLPDQFVHWTEPQQRMVLLHELAHIVRKDASVHTLLVILNSIYWFNPLVWFILRQMRQLSEEACDQVVIDRGVKPSDYADHLLNILQTIKNHRNWGLTGATMTTKSFKHMGGRIMKILTNGPISKSPRLIRIVWVVTMMICSVFLLGSFQTEAGDKPVPPKADDTKLTDKTGEKLPASIDFVPMDTMPEMVIESAPVYPKEAKDKKIEGDVWVKALILKDGSVHEAQIAKSSGHALLDKSAVTTAKKNRFKPGYKDDKPVACWVTYRVSFVLEEKKK